MPLQDSKLVICFICENPDGRILLNGRANPVGIHFGDHPQPASLTIWLATDTLHEIMLGDLGIMKAMGQKKIKAKGSLLKAASLSQLFSESQKIYPQILNDAGLY
jgi:hypothetical protein